MNGLKKLQEAWIAAAISCVPLTAQAVTTYEWPVLTSVSVTLTSSTTATYDLTWTKSTVVLHAEPEISTRDYYNMMMNKSDTTAIIQGALRHRHLEPNGVTTGGAAIGLVKKSDEPWLEFASTLTANMLSTPQILHSNGQNVSECVGVMTGYESRATSAGWSDLVAGNFDPTLGAGACIGTPPPHQWCALVTPAVQLKFGTMTLRNVSDARAKANVQVSCTTGMKYLLRLQGQASAIPLANGMGAELTADGSPLGSTLQGQTGTQDVSLEGKLTGTPASGSLDGSGVLFVSYP
jgi:hypothetical protein